MMVKCLLCLIVFICSFHVQAAETADFVTIGLLAGGDRQATQQQSYQFAEKLQNLLNKPVKIFIPKDYSGLIEALKNKKVDFAAMSALSYVVAEKQVPLKVLLKKTWQGSFYYSAIVTRKKSKLKKIEDLKKVKFAFVDEKSTSGYMYPMVFLKNKKISTKDFKQISFSGSHSASIEQLESGAVDAVAVFADDENGKVGAWTRFSKNKANYFNILWISEPIPNDPIVVRQDFYDENPKLTHEIMYNLIELQNNDSKSLFEVLGKGPLMPATAKQYDPVREMQNVFQKEIQL